MAFSGDMKEQRIDQENSNIWFHGSQVKMTILRSGSSITRNKNLAIAFSHRPTQVSVENDGSIQHNGQENGYLYILNEDINDDDIRVHESCELDDPWE
ncbi:hypothetical protein KQI42_14440 [Tissierella sp. MSJ-40]|uniref:Uncharacterized protein n=1 Tax=Tissierella simiarum TaxID=2841534 RepID=A0ABS6E8I4_9FIRM|nr:hypothetical protein [Tissierella simiarum]MBU5439218.1 hypothetical protein [Tissierella simiarum]